ncbi:multidrug effflux MFS transporter [Mangrovivirga cuniculi]|uniref:Bcr/CflA family drug resistance efflux transporter n=1 Tax=Mangrovivirga cuniculi TaxID=2715131 RepID=A0A4D7JKG3_9BACT|nr:multidrug effflux MFS transporter [Mangrovivirga cuniculi]QCK15187.1 Bcr/CflA family drug resistance efflux transporter [Mangrovivirga cuniculi]
MTKEKKDHILLILILGLLTTVGPFSIDMYLPAFSDIAQDMDTNISRVPLTLSSFFIGLAVGQLIYGPILERFGRKKPIYTGMLIYVLASIACALSSSLEEMIVYRFFQALGSCAGLVSARAIVRDLFKGKKVAKIFSTLIMVVAISPIIAPTAGGLLNAQFGWRSIFIVLGIMSILILIGAIFILPETKSSDKGYSLNLISVFRTYFKVIKHPSFIINAMTGAIAYSGLYAYLSGSPELYMDVLGLTEQQYGWIFALIATGLITATQLNNRFLRKRDMDHIIKLALAAQGFVGLILMGYTLFMEPDLIVNTTLIFSFLFFLGFIFPNASALSLEPMGHVAGNASALMGSLQMLVGAGASALVGLFDSNAYVPMTIVMGFCPLLALGLFMYGHQRIIPEYVKQNS